MSFVSTITALAPSHWWRFKEPSGTTTTDEIAGATGTYVNGPVVNQTGLLSGDASPSVLLDGVNDKISLGDRHDFAGSQPFTMILWAKPLANGTDRRLASKYSSGNGWRWLTSGTRIDFQRLVGGSQHQTTWSGTVPLNTVAMFAVTFDGTTVSLYLNRTKLSTSASGTAQSLADSALNLTVGADHDTGGPLNADVQDFAVWDGTVLDEFDIYALYDAGLNQTPPGANILATGNRRPHLPIGAYNVNNQPMSLAAYRMAIRFVLDRQTTCYRFLSQFNCEGTTWLTPSDTNHARGTGGSIKAELVTCKVNGEPDLGNVLATETWVVQTRYAESKAAFSVPSDIITELLYSNMGSVVLAADTLYAMVYSNPDADPDANHVSTNCPCVREDVAGPHNANTLSKLTAGAVCGLDPREAAAWSQNAGSSWTWGWEVGGGSGHNSYNGHSVGIIGGNSVVRLPSYGIQESASVANIHSNSPYTAYQATTQTAHTLKCKLAPRACTLVRAGGMTKIGTSLGVVTVTNLRTGDTGSTASLGDGMVDGPLDTPVPIAVGDAFTVASSGAVPVRQGDDFVLDTYGLGAASLDWPFEHEAGYDMPNLYALDSFGQWPYYDLPSTTTPGRLPRGLAAT